MSRYDENSVNKGIGIKARRVIAYTVLIFFSIHLSQNKYLF